MMTIKRYATQPVGECGHEVNKRGVKLCRSCWQAKMKTSRNQCEECGADLPNQQTAKKCRSCWMKGHRSPHKECTMPSCSEEHFAQGLCYRHYHRAWQSNNPTLRRTADKIAVSKMPCTICGYSKMRSRVHRLDGKQKYVLGNMVAVCARCHDEIHMGLIPHPPATIP